MAPENCPKRTLANKSIQNENRRKVDISQPPLEAANAADTSRVLGFDKNHIAIVNMKGEVQWEFPNEAGSMHDIQLLSNGNILYHNGPNVREVTPAKEIVWEYQSKAKEGYTGRFSVHSFERLPNGLTMIAESGNQRIIEVDKTAKSSTRFR